MDSMQNSAIIKADEATTFQLHYKYISKASEALTMSVAFPPLTVVDSYVSVPWSKHVPFAKVWPPTAGLPPWSCLDVAAGAVNLFVTMEDEVSPVSVKF